MQTLVNLLHINFLPRAEDFFVNNGVHQLAGRLFNHLIEMPKHIINAGLLLWIEELLFDNMVVFD